MKIGDPGFWDSNAWERFLDGWYSTGTDASHSPGLKEHFDAIKKTLVSAGSKPRNVSWLQFGARLARKWLETHPKIRKP